MHRWKRLKSAYLLRHRIVNIRQDTCLLPGGAIIGDYYVVEENDVGMVFALTPDHRLILVEQYKHGVGEVCLELPAGLFDERSGDPLAEARREFVEETGYDAVEYRYVGAFIQNPTRMNSRVHLFIALDASRLGDQQLDSNEEIIVHLTPIEDALDMVRQGRIDAMGTVAGILLALDALRRDGIIAFS